MMDQARPSRTILRIQGIGALLLLLLFSAGMLLRLDPFATWYYPLAWWPFILAMDALVCALQGHSMLWRDPRGFLVLSLMSVPVWLLFELVNLVLQNWYYVGSSHSRLVRWVGYTISFATVLPGILEATELAGAMGLFRRVGVRPIRVTSRTYAKLWVLGALCILLPLVWPRYGFPFIWLGVVFLLEPFIHRWGHGGLLRDWENGTFTTLVRLLAGGLICGFAWEFFNISALSKWIYTVPFFDELKLFEMPVAGFLGFPPFAVECYVIVQFVGMFRRGGRLALTRPMGWCVAGLVGLGSVGAFHLLDLYTVSSLQPRLEALRDLAPQEASLLEQAGVRRLDLWVQKPGTRAKESLALDLLGLSPQAVAKWKQWAALASLKGMGTGNLRLLMEAGVRSIAELAAQDPERLGPQLRAIQERTGWARHSPRDSQVRVWVREAGRMCAGGNRGKPLPCE
jgi:hypothetical protein